jgi:hypothetical protein
MGCSSTSKVNSNTIKKNPQNPQSNTNAQSAPANPTNSNPTNANTTNQPNSTTNAPAPIVDAKPQVVAPLPPQVLTGVHALYDLGIPTSKSI